MFARLACGPARSLFFVGIMGRSTKFFGWFWNCDCGYKSARSMSFCGACGKHWAEGWTERDTKGTLKGSGRPAGKGAAARANQQPADAPACAEPSQEDSATAAGLKAHADCIRSLLPQVADKGTKDLLEKEPKDIEKQRAQLLPATQQRQSLEQRKENV